MQCKKGFTLVEILISVAILALMGIFTGSSVFNTFKVKNKVENSLETYDVGRSVLRSISRDISLAFHRPKIDKKTKGNDFLVYEEDKNRMRTSLIGKDSDPFDEIHFTSLSHRRFYKDVNESNMAEISYFVELTKEDDQDTMTLFKRELSVIDDNVMEGGRAYKIAEGVTFLNFKYWDCEKEEYIDSWDSIEGTYVKGLFPEAVHVSLGLDDMNGGEFVFETVVIIEMPNNIPRNNEFLSNETSGFGQPDCPNPNDKCEKDMGETYDNCPYDCKELKSEAKFKLLKKTPVASCRQ